MKLSIIIPVFNEERTITKVLSQITDIKIPGIQKEIIIVDDGSTDKTVEKIKFFTRRNKDIQFFIHDHNMGKGKAVKTGIEHANGDYIIIQDADLEYNPSFISSLIMPIQEGRAKVVYGTRLKRLPNIFNEEKTFRFLLHYFGNRFLSLITSILYGQWITDMETCYKLFPREAINNIQLKARGFELEPEITAKLMKKGYRITEVPISTKPRGYEEGKKLNTLRDGRIALWTLIKYRFSD